MFDHTIRDFRISDAASVASLNDQARIDGYCESGFVILPLGEEQICAEATASEVTYLIYEADGLPVAFLKYSSRAFEEYQEPVWFDGPVDTSRGLHIEKIVVERGHRGMGIGRALYTQLVKRSAGRTLFTYVTVSPCENRASVRFHEALDFQSAALVPYRLPDGSWFREALYVRR